jgi:hypothetical protein
MSIYICISLPLLYYTLLDLLPDEFPRNQASRLPLGKLVEIRYNAMQASSSTH